MGDTITTGGGIQTVSPSNPGFDRRHWRDRDSRDWPDLTLTGEAAVTAARQMMGLPPYAPGTKISPLKLFIEPAAVTEFTHGWDTRAQTGDERFLEVIARRPCQIYLRRGVNQVLLHNRRA